MPSVNAYRVTRDFEAALCEYTGAPFAVAVNSCTAALQLALEYLQPWRVTIPCRTYVSVPCAIRHAGMEVAFEDIAWSGAYQLQPTAVWDCARRFTSGMYVAGQFQCVSFAAAKILGIEQGGAILHDNPRADVWFRKARFDGREEGKLPQEQQLWDVLGHHCIMLPSVAAALLVKLHHLPRHNADLPDYPYPDLSTLRSWD